jgi:hypothetical protein
MPEFVILDREYPRITQLLLEHAPSFGESVEFHELDPPDLDLPSVVCGAFRRFVQRVHLAEGSLDPPTERVSQTVRAIERLASSADAEVANALVVDVFEHLDMPAQTLQQFVDRLGPSARALYQRWIDPQAGHRTT